MEHLLHLLHSPTAHFYPVDAVLVKIMPTPTPPPKPPPFGTKKKHADREFLMKAFETADVIYTFHKTTSKEFIAKISSDNGFVVTHYYEFDFPLKMEHLFHKHRIHRIKVGCWRVEKMQKTLG